MVPMREWIDPGLKLSNEDMAFDPIGFLDDRLEALTQRKQVVLRALLIPGRVRGRGDAAYDKQFLKVAATQLDSLIKQLKGGWTNDRRRITGLKDRLGMKKVHRPPELDPRDVNRLAIMLDTADWLGDWRIEAHQLCRKLATIKSLLPRAEAKQRHIGQCLHHMENEVQAIEHLHRKVG